MKGLEPSLLEKLLDEAPKAPPSGNAVKAISLDQYKESVARDLEGLLNSRAAFSEEDIESFPNCRRSMMTYGLRDFSSMSLASAPDRAAICRSIEQAIARHEPRLHGVRVLLDTGVREAKGLHFTIHGLLDVQPAREPISFDALLQTATLQYSISRLRRPVAA